MDLAQFDAARPGWMTSDRDLWWIAEHLAGVRHTTALTPSMIRRLHRLDRRTLDAALVGYRKPAR